MKQISYALIAALLVLGVSCNRDPKVVAQGYVQKGNRYFDAGKFKEASLMYRKAVGKNKLSADAWYRLAQAEFRLGRIFPEGVNALRYSVSLNPDNTKAHVQLGEIYLVNYLGTHKEVWAKEFDLLLKKVKPNTADRNRLEGAQALYIKRDFKEAIAKYEAAKAAAPFSTEIVFPYVQALLLDNRAADAEKMARETVEKAKGFEPVYDVLFDLYLKTNRLPEAEAILKLKVANNPKSGAALRGLAAFYRGTKRIPEMTQAIDRLASDAASFPNGRLMAGDFFFFARDYDSAIRYLEPGVQGDSKRKAEYQKRIARALIAQSKKKEAAAMLARVVADKPEDAEAKAMNGELLIETDPAKAASELQQAVGKLSANPELRLNLARALMAKRPLSSQDLEQARVNYEEAVRMAPRNVPARLGLTQVLIAKRDYAGAITSVNEILNIDPRAFGAKLLRSLAQAQLGNYPQARADLTDVLKDRPQSLEAALQLAYVSLAEKRLPEAEERFTRLRQVARQEMRVVIGLTNTYTALRKFDNAIELLKAEVQRQPGKEEPLLLLLGQVAAASGNHDLAVSTLKTATEKNPRSADAWFRLAMVHRLKRDINTAIDCLRKARQIQPANPQLASELGMALEATGRKDEARQLYEDVLKSQPDHPIALNNLAFMIAETGGDLDRALMLAQKAKQKWPDNPEVADTLGWIYIRKDLSDPAIEIFRDLVAKRPNNSIFHYHLGMALYQKGDRPQAKKALQSALQQKPSKDDETKIRDLMAKIG